MNNQNNQMGSNGSNCCIDICKSSFSAEGQEIVNNYKCNQRPFSNTDLWNIQKRKRQFVIGTNIIIH